MWKSQQDAVALSNVQKRHMQHTIAMGGHQRPRLGEDPHRGKHGDPHRGASEARDTRAEWATQEGKSGELLQNTNEEMNEDMKASFGRLLFGSLASRRRKLPGLNDPTDRRP